MFRNILRLCYVSLPAALLMAFAAHMYRPTQEVALFIDLVQGNITMDSYPSTLLNSLTLLRYGKYWWIFLISILVLAFAAALLVVKIDRHMRTGQMPILPIRRMLGIYPLMLLYVVCTVVLSELGTLVVVGLSLLMRFVGNATAIVSVVLALVFAVRVLIIAFPLKYGENYRFNRALSYSARIMFRKKRVVWGVALLYPVCRMLMLTVAYFAQPYLLDLLVYAVVFFFAVSYVPCLSYKQYYDDVGGERRDVGQIMFG